MANALRFYMQLAETKDIGDVNTHLLDAVMVMAYKFYIKGGLHGFCLQVFLWLLFASV